MSSENEENSLFSKFKKLSRPQEAPPARSVPAPAPVPVAANPVPAAPPPADNKKIEGLEAEVKELKEQVASLKSVLTGPPSPAAEPTGPAVSPKDLSKPDLAAAAEEAGLTVRMERSENLIAELKVLVTSQQAQLSRYAEQKLIAEGLGEYLRDMVSRLNTKVVEAENMMHISLSDMSARLTGHEAVYGKMFSDAENLMKKSVSGEIAALDAHLKKLRESVVWLADEYKIVMERKIRALEGKYAAFEAISNRMDSIDAALKKGGKIGPY